MSLRLHAKLGDKTYQVLGNNEFPQCLIDELNKQGANVNGDGCFGYNWDNEGNRQYTFKVTDLNGIIKALEQYIVETEEEYQKNKSFYEKINNGLSTAATIADFSSEVFLHPAGHYMTETIKEIMDLGYIFCSANLLKFIGRANYYWTFIEGKNDVEFAYKLKDNVELYMYAY